MDTPIPSTAEPAQNPAAGVIHNPELNSAGARIIAAATMDFPDVVKLRAHFEALEKEWPGHYPGPDRFRQFVGDIEQCAASHRGSLPPVQPPPITKASVRVMRSHDYCHFEVVLSTDGEFAFEGFGSAREVVGTKPLTEVQVDELRKAAARLCDKAVAQFIVAKQDAVQRINARQRTEWDRRNAERIRAKAETDRTPEEQAELKAFDDAVFRAHREPYDYEDHWPDDDEEDDAS